MGQTSYPYGTTARLVSNVNRPFHPLLFAIYPILFLYSQNTAEFPPEVISGPIIVCLGLTFFVGGILMMISRNRLRSAFLLSVFLLVFFSYGHFYHLLEKSEISADPKVVLSLYGVLLIILLILSFKKIQDWNRATRFFNLLSVCLIALTLFNTANSFFKSSRTNAESATPSSKPPVKDAPDIFYIILDGYPRHDILQKVHQFDNSEFLEFLKTKGFQILESSHSNYPGTSLSLSSSLNFSYLDQIVPAEEIHSGNRWYLKKLIERNRAMDFLKKHGYVTAAFDSGYFATEIKDVDHFYATGWFLNEFHEALLDTTPAWVAFKNVGRYAIQRRRILYIFDHLSEVKDPSRPVFVFAHIMALHPPFVFGPNGEERNQQSSSLKFWEDFREPSKQQLSQQYQDQLKFVNRKVKAAVEAILANRTRPVYIVLQGDHGSSFVSPANELDYYQERFSILNAIRLSKENQLYDSMSPVNTFRVLLNSFFETDFKLLQDRSYYSQRDEPYQWKDITEKLSR